MFSGKKNKLILALLMAALVSMSACQKKASESVAGAESTADIAVETTDDEGVADVAGESSEVESTGATDDKETTDSTAADGTDSQVADASEMAAPVELDTDGLTPIEASELVDGTYEIKVDSSSTMFTITDCELTVAEGKMTALLTMGGHGYRYLYMGTGEEAVEASEEEYIPYVETEDGTHTFTVPVEALNVAVDCAAFSDKKEKWYDRILIFRPETLPLTAFVGSPVKTVSELGLADGSYTVDVVLGGGSGKASVESPAQLSIKDGEAFATIVWSSKNYDYMLVNGERYDNENPEGNSTFTIPVSGFDGSLPVVGDTTAMSTPYEIDYTLNFAAHSIQKVE